MLRSHSILLLTLCSVSHFISAEVLEGGHHSRFYLNPHGVTRANHAEAILRLLEACV